MKGIFKGVMSLICRPTAGCLDLVQRVFEGLVNTPDAMFDQCQLDDFRQREAAVGTDLWWERVADPDGAAVRPIQRFTKPPGCVNGCCMLLVAGDGVRSARRCHKCFVIKQEC